MLTWATVISLPPSLPLLPFPASLLSASGFREGSSFWLPPPSPPPSSIASFFLRLGPPLPLTPWAVEMTAFLAEEGMTPPEKVKGGEKEARKEGGRMSKSGKREHQALAPTCRARRGRPARSPEGGGGRG